jgi:hypothetical protein
MFESKLGTERERDMHKIEGAKLKAQPKNRVEEKLYITKKKEGIYLRKIFISINNQIHCK